MRFIDRVILRPVHSGRCILFLFNLNFNRWQITKHATNVTVQGPRYYKPTKARIIENSKATAQNATARAKSTRDVFSSMKTNNYAVRFYNVCPRTFKRKATIKTVQAYDQRHALRIIDRHANLIISIKKIS